MLMFRNVRVACLRRRKISEAKCTPPRREKTRNTCSAGGSLLCLAYVQLERRVIGWQDFGRRRIQIDGR